MNTNLTATQKTKKEMLRDAIHVMRALSSSALKHEIKEEVKRIKEEKLRGSCTYEEVAEEFGIYPRSLREYVSGRRKPGLGKPATRYGFLLEKYYLNKELNRWFVRDDYDWRNEPKVLR